MLNAKGIHLSVEVLKDFSHGGIAHTHLTILMRHIIEAELTRNDLIPPTGEILLCIGSELARLLLIAFKIVFAISSVCNISLKVCSKGVCRRVQQKQIFWDAVLHRILDHPASFTTLLIRHGKKDADLVVIRITVRTILCITKTVQESLRASRIDIKHGRSKVPGQVIRNAQCLCKANRFHQILGGKLGTDSVFDFFNVYATGCLGDNAHSTVLHRFFKQHGLKGWLTMYHCTGDVGCLARRPTRTEECQVDILIGGHQHICFLHTGTDGVHQEYCA